MPKKLDHQFEYCGSSKGLCECGQPFEAHPEAQQRKIPAKLSIELFFHCNKCLKEMPSGGSPQSWAMLSMGFTKLGIQVWCNRHNCNVIHIDFQGLRHPANMRVYHG